MITKIKINRRGVSRVRERRKRKEIEYESKNKPIEHGYHR